MNEFFILKARIGLTTLLAFSIYICVLAPTTTVALIDITPVSPSQIENRVIITDESNRLGASHVLDYNNTSIFPNSEKKHLPNGTNTVILYGDKKEGTLWAKPLKENITYIETSLRVIAENKTDNHAGLVWKMGNMSYYVFLRPQSMAAYNSVDKVFAKTNSVSREDGSWYDVKIVIDKENILAYVDNILMLRFPSVGSGEFAQVGLRSVNSITEFSPVIVAGGEQEKNQDVFYSLVN